KLARFVVLARSGPAPAPELAKRVAPGRIVYAQNDAVLISSTEILNRVRAGQSIDAFVDPVVSRYIHHYGLYKEERKAGATPFNIVSVQPFRQPSTKKHSISTSCSSAI